MRNHCHSEEQSDVGILGSKSKMCVRQTKPSEIVNYHPRNSVKNVLRLICRDRIYTYMCSGVFVCTY